MNIAKSKSDKIMAVFDSIKDMPVIVFGSASTKGLSNANDIDVLLDLDATPANKKFVKQLRLIAYQFYGWFDPFVLKDGVLWVRNDEATGWIQAKNARGILADARKFGKSPSEVSL